MKNLLLSFLLSACFASSGFGQLIAGWNTNDFNGPLSGTSLSTHLTAGKLNRGTGLNYVTGGLVSYNSSNWHQSDFASAKTAGDFLYLTFTVDQGWEITGFQVDAWLQRSGTGPKDGAFALDLDGDADPLNSLTQWTPIVGINEQPGSAKSSGTYGNSISGTITVALLAWNATSASGTLRLPDDKLGFGEYGLTLSGTLQQIVTGGPIIPEPATVGGIALLLGLAWLGFRRRTARRAP